MTSITMGGKVFTLSFDMKALLTLESFGFKIEQLDELWRKWVRKPNDASTDDKLSLGQRSELALKLIYAMTRTNDAPPAMLDLERMTVQELTQALPRITEAWMEGLGGPVPQGEVKAAVADEAPGVPRGTGAPPSSKRSRSVV